MYCTNCGTKVPKNAKICGNCGQPLKAVAERQEPSAPKERVASALPPKRVKPASQPRVKTARRLPVWTWAAVAVLVIGTIAAFWYFSVSPSSEQSAPSAFEPDTGESSVQAPSTTAEEVDSKPANPEPTAAASTDPVYVYVGSLWPRDDNDLIAPANTPLVLFLGWATRTSEYAQQFLDAIKLEILFDGEPISNPMAYWAPIEEIGDYDNDGINDYSVQWQYPIDELSPGTYLVEVNFTYDFVFTDGFDENEDGNEDTYGGEYWEDKYSKTLIVE